MSVAGVRVATTPSEVQLPFDDAAEVRVKLSLDGYRDEELRVLPDADHSREVKLSPVRREAAPARPTPAQPPKAPRAKGDPVDPFAP